MTRGADAMSREPVAIKNSYDVKRAIGQCGRCTSDAAPGSAHCAACQERNRQRLRTARDASRKVPYRPRRRRC